MEAKHTPGPWQLHREKETFQGAPRDAEIRGAGGRYVVVRLGKINHDQQDANARLIAAAPDLLAACEALERWSRDNGGGAYLEGLKWTKDIQDAVCDARAAIAAAKGGAA